MKETYPFAKWFAYLAGQIKSIKTSWFDCLKIICFRAIHYMENLFFFSQILCMTNALLLNFELILNILMIEAMLVLSLSVIVICDCCAVLNPYIQWRTW